MSIKTKKPELLAPAGDMECLIAAVKYGADAVYIGGKVFGMRAAPANFSAEQLPEAVKYAHDRGVKVYLTCNVLPRNNELSELPEFLLTAKDAGIDALIVSDIGVLSMAKKIVPDMEIHISTQSGIVNYVTSNAFYELGAKRIVTARELSLREIAEIRENIPEDMDIECFVHGAMCVSFSGRCLISNYLVSRDANRGECAQPCRWKYTLMEEKRPGQYFPIEERDGGTYILNSKDMCMIEHIPEMIESGITSFKIEGRAKSAYYVASVVNAYRTAIDAYYDGMDIADIPWIADEMRKISYRDYCTGFFFGDPKDGAAISYKGGYNREWDVMAVVDCCADGKAYCTQRNRFFEGDVLEVLECGKAPYKVTVKHLTNDAGEAIETANHPMMKITFDCDIPIPEGSYLRKERPECERVIV